jgi:hypothetical protein
MTKTEVKRLGLIGSSLLVAIIAHMLALPGFAGSDGHDDTLEFLLNAHRSAVQALRTVSCDVKQESGPPDHLKTLAIGHYSRSDDRVRITYRMATNNLMEDVLITNSEQRSLGKQISNKGAAVTTGSRKAAREANPFCDAWRAMLLSLPSGHVEWLALDRLLEQAKKPPSVQ